MLPELLLFGQAGSGKDSAAAILCESQNGVALAMADPMKRLAYLAFGFTEDQLWGPSANRNAMDSRFTIETFDGSIPVWYNLSPAWEQAVDFIISNPETKQWIAEVLGWDVGADSTSAAHDQLVTWIDSVVGHAIKAGGLTPRAVLQTLGTEWGRLIDPKMWIRYAQRAQRQLLAGGYEYSRTQGLIPTKGAQYDMAIVTDGRFPNECLEFKANGATVIRVRDPQGEAASAAAQAAGIQGHSSETAQLSIPDFWFDSVIWNDKRLGLENLQDLLNQFMGLQAPLNYTALSGQSPTICL